MRRPICSLSLVLALASCTTVPSASSTSAGGGGASSSNGLSSTSALTSAASSTSDSSGSSVAMCDPTCAAQETCCDDDSGPATCHNLESDTKACGACGTVCGSGETCISKECSCGGGAACVDNLECKSGACQCVDAVVTCPSKTCCVSVKGVSVTSYQGTIDWATVAATGVSFGFARVADGLTPDTTFATNWAGMKGQGLRRGAYLFFRPGADPTAQADSFTNKVSAAGLEAGDVLYVDVETLDGQSVAAVKTALDTALARIKATTNHTPLIYTGFYFWQQFSPSMAPAQYPLVVADYSTCPKLPAGWNVWTFWEYDGSLSVAGISGMTAGVYFNGTMNELDAFLGVQALGQPWSPSGLCGFK